MHGQVGEIVRCMSFIFNPKHMKIACKDSQILNRYLSFRSTEDHPAPLKAGSPPLCLWASLLSNALLIFIDFEDYQRKNYIRLDEWRNGQETVFLFQFLLLQSLPLRPTIRQRATQSMLMMRR